MACKLFLNLPGGAKIPAIGLGTWQSKDELELETAINTALEQGYRHIDTAWVYENEKIIGRVLKKWFDSGRIKREELFITTKLPMIGVHPDRVELFIKNSLANLQLSYLDLYLIHFPVGFKYEEGALRPVHNDKGEIPTEPHTDHSAIWKKMEEQVKQGRTKAIGVSNYNIRQIQTILDSCEIKPVNLQVELHVYLQQPELVDFCKRNNITVVAYSPLGSPGYNKFLQKFGAEEKELPNILGDRTIAKIAQKHGKSPAQIALRFLLQKGIGAIPKSVTPNRVQQNMDLFNFELDGGDMKEITQLNIGEEARICDFVQFSGVVSHPEYPWK